MDISALSTSVNGQLEQANASRDASTLQRAASSRSPEEAGKQFEAMLGTMLAKELRKGLDEGFFGSGPGADSFSAWLDEYVGRVMAEQGTLGTGSLVRQYVAEVEGAVSAGDAEADAESRINAVEPFHSLETDSHKSLESKSHLPLEPKS